MKKWLESNKVAILKGAMSFWLVLRIYGHV